MRIYVHMTKPLSVTEEEALDYVLKQCGIAIVDDRAPDLEEFKRDMVDWYFSGPWVEAET